jgi:hypothetical protein
MVRLSWALAIVTLSLLGGFRSPLKFADGSPPPVKKPSSEEGPLPEGWDYAEGRVAGAVLVTGRNRKEQFTHLHTPDNGREKVDPGCAGPDFSASADH